MQDFIKPTLEDPSLGFHEHLIFTLMAGEVTPEVPVYSLSVKRLILASGHDGGANFIFDRRFPLRLNNNSDP